MIVCRVSAAGVSLRQPSHSLAGTVEHPPAKSGTQASIIQVADFIIDAVPFAEDFD